jgi:hypothetical protein
VSNGFTPDQKRAVLLRDGHRCPVCGLAADEVNHRANRGAGGYKAGNTLANACAICRTCNGLIESNADTANTARHLGVKISRDDDPTRVPLWSPFFHQWVQITDTGLYLLGDTNRDRQPAIA